jgi:hypothetical protein
VLFSAGLQALRLCTVLAAHPLRSALTAEPDNVNALQEHVMRRFAHSINVSSASCSGERAA